MSERALTAREYWERHPRLQTDIFRFAEEYADYSIEQAQEVRIERIVKESKVEARRQTRRELEAEREGEWQERVAGPALGMEENDDKN